MSGSAVNSPRSFRQSGSQLRDLCRNGLSPWLIAAPTTICLSYSRPRYRPVGKDHGPVRKSGIQTADRSRSEWGYRHCRPCGYRDWYLNFARIRSISRSRRSGLSAAPASGRGRSIDAGISANGRQITATECVAVVAEGMIHRCFFSLLLLRLCFQIACEDQRSNDA